MVRSQCGAEGIEPGGSLGLRAPRPAPPAPGPRGRGLAPPRKAAFRWRSAREYRVHPGEERWFHVEHTPVEPSTSLGRRSFDQAVNVRIDHLDEERRRQLGQRGGRPPIQPRLGLTRGVVAEADPVVGVASPANSWRRWAPRRMRRSVLRVRNDRPRLSTKIASRSEVLPEPLAPWMTVSRGAARGARARCSGGIDVQGRKRHRLRRRLRAASASRRSERSHSRRGGRQLLLASVRPSSALSVSMAARASQVRDVEADLQGIALVVDLDLILGLFLLGVVRLDVQLSAAERGRERRGISRWTGWPVRCRAWRSNSRSAVMIDRRVRRDHATIFGNLPSISFEVKRTALIVARMWFVPIFSSTSPSPVRMRC